MNGRQLERLSTKIMNAQVRWIRQAFGGKAARAANYGWGIEGLVISTKVYGKGVLTSTIEHGQVTHRFEDFE